MTFLYTHHLSPFLVSFWWGGHRVGIRWYGLAYLLGFALSYQALRRAVLENRVPNLNQESLDRLAVGLIAGVVGGGRLGFVLQNLGTWRADWLFPLRLAGGGMTFLGGLIGVLLAVAWSVHSDRLAFWQVTDLLAKPAALALAFGRIANFINGELVGSVTNGHWGVIFPNVDGHPRHPSQLYEAASHFALWGLLLWISRNRSEWCRRPGRLSLVFVSFYGFARFLTDFFRVDTTYLGAWSLGQWVSLGMGVLALGLILARKRTVEPDIAPDPVLFDSRT